MSKTKHLNRCKELNWWEGGRWRWKTKKMEKPVQRKYTIELKRITQKSKREKWKSKIMCVPVRRSAISMNNEFHEDLFILLTLRVSFVYFPNIHISCAKPNELRIKILTTRLVQKIFSLSISHCLHFTYFTFWIFRLYTHTHTKSKLINIRCYSTQ